MILLLITLNWVFALRNTLVIIYINIINKKRIKNIAVNSKNTEEADANVDRKLILHEPPHPLINKHKLLYIKLIVLTYA